MTQAKLFIIELCVAVHFLALLIFGIILYSFDLGIFSYLGLGTTFLLSVPIGICHYLFVKRFNPPIASRVLQNPGNKANPRYPETQKAL